MTSGELRTFTADEHETWRQLFERQTPLREVQLVPEFSRGLQLLGIDGRRIPDLRAVNDQLIKLTGFRGVAVKGLEGPEGFFGLLAKRQFPIGNFIRDKRDLNYTPEPDVFHDLYGHLPFYADQRYADFNQWFGERALKDAHNPQQLRTWERLYWFALEFGLLETPAGLRIWGAGIASSFGECAFALQQTGGPERLPFNLDQVRQQEFRIDELQKRLFVFKSRAALFEIRDALETVVINRQTQVTGPQTGAR